MGHINSRSSLGTPIFARKSQRPMTNKELRSILFKEKEKFGKLKIFLLCVSGAILGWVTNWTYNYINTPKILETKSSYAVDYNGYLGIVIDRKLTSTCDLKPDRILFKLDSIDGQTIPVILPVGQQSSVWPAG